MTFDSDSDFNNSSFEKLQIKEFFLFYFLCYRELPVYTKGMFINYVILCWVGPKILD